ncbi:amidohydrolase [Frankia sp. AgB1.9]|uniref:amidohydrolase family protein n=1 Tax=unclassified Frankia TaxID=2632575 RepID=UPI001932902B|nr:MULTISPECIES: amidohydrolase family protein [unclassified Frankia]MBL7491479.1 amidohydrolase [Frankia sp. AgW1.1]MBL7547794.1 amidohydrolase [Frankia sp. AgB1.9]MBL7621744.1 amidohydrolase [Frankia sp. AgB1.8]
MAARYTIISADTHAGANHETYREYLDPSFLEDFDAWRGRYKNPWKDLRDTDLRVRNWDDERRDRDQLAQGVVGEVIFPNTVPPFYPGFVLFAGPPKAEEYRHRRAGIQAHNRWLADFCSRKAAQRAGVGQIFLNDIDDAIADATWIKENNLRGGVLLPNVAPDVSWVKPLYDPEYDRLWAALQDLEIPVNLHGGTGSPNYGRYAATPALMISEVGFYGMRPFVHMLLAGVFEKFPRLKFVITEASAAGIPPLLKQLDGVLANIRGGSIGELKYRKEDALSRSATEYFEQSCWVGASFPRPDDVAARSVIGADRWMWGNDYPHDEGTTPFTHEALRQVLHHLSEAELRAALGGNAARLYGFDLDALAPLAAQYGPTVEEVAEPLLALPENANMALRNAQAQLTAA